MSSGQRCPFPRIILAAAWQDSKSVLFLKKMLFWPSLCDTYFSLQKLRISSVPRCLSGTFSPGSTFLKAELRNVPFQLTVGHRTQGTHRCTTWGSASREYTRGKQVLGSFSPAREIPCALGSSLGASSGEVRCSARTGIWDRGLCALRSQRCLPSHPLESQL